MGSSLRRRASAASRSPAAQPSVRACRSADLCRASGRGRRPSAASSVSSTVKRRASARSSCSLPFQPEAGNRDRRVDPAGDDQLQARGTAADQPGEVAQHLPAGQLVQVVQDEAHRRVEGVEHFGEGLHDVRPAPQRRARPASLLQVRPSVGVRKRQQRRQDSATRAAAGRCRPGRPRPRPSPETCRCRPSPPGAASCRSRQAR